MSAPEVGDRVRVIGDPYRGQFGHVADPTLVASAYLWGVWVALDGDSGPPLGFDLSEVEKVPMTPDSTTQSDEQGADVGLGLDATSGPQNVRTPGPDMTLPGEAFCVDCPDHEACANGYPCDMVHRVAREAAARRRRAKS